MRLKICGMKLNMAEVGQLQPDYLGFIFYKGSPRYCEDQATFAEELKALPEEIKKVGVFVDAEISDILAKIDQFKLHIVQLHGNESAAYCKKLKAELKSKFSCAEPVEVWKVFGIKDEFNFSILKDYEPFVDKFLFDTKGKAKGGNGYTFDWSVLKAYSSKKPFILSGGIGPQELDKLKELSKTDLPLYGIDVNSKFETEPGSKDVELLRDFKEKLLQV